MVNYPVSFLKIKGEFSFEIQTKTICNIEFGRKMKNVCAVGDFVFVYPYFHIWFRAQEVCYRLARQRLLSPGR